MGVQHIFTAPYCPQETPTERANRTINTTIAEIAKNQHNKWDEHLPVISLALNTTTSESTGYSPAHLAQCREPRLPTALYDEVVPGTGATNARPTDRVQELQKVFKIVRHQLARVAEDQWRHYNLRRRPWKSKIGTLVLVHQHPLSKVVDNFAAKLAPKFDGPYVVLNSTSPVIVRVRGQEKGDLRTAHLSDIKPFVENPTPDTQSHHPDYNETKCNILSPAGIISTNIAVHPLERQTPSSTEMTNNQIFRAKAYYKEMWLEQERSPRMV